MRSALDTGGRLSDLSDSELAAHSHVLASNAGRYRDVLAAELVARVEGLRGRHRPVPGVREQLALAEEGRWMKALGR